MNVRSNLDRMAKEAARENRQQLASAGVVAVNILGAPGCGKTSLLHASIQGLLLKRRIGIVRADPHCQCDRPQKLGDQFVHVDTGARVAMTPGDLRRALAELNLSSLDLLLIENVSSPTGPENVDLGEQAKVAVYSVAAGNDKVGKYPELVRRARLIILNKIDLNLMTPFDRAAFRRTVARFNPEAQVLELSMSTGQGVDAWLDWLIQNTHRASGTGRMRGDSGIRQRGGLS